MAGRPEDDVLELTETDKEPVEIEDQDEASTEGEPADGETDEIAEIVFGDEAAPASGEHDTPAIRQMRKELRETQRQLAEARKQAAPRAIEVGEKPTLAGCDYDEERFEGELDAWKTRKAEAEKAETVAQAQQREWQEYSARQVQAYESGKSALRFPDAQAFHEAEHDILPDAIRKVVIEVADNPALVMYSIFKRPDKGEELSKITNPIGLVKAITKLEGNLKVATRRKAPDPERISSGSASLAMGSDKTLERLEKEAERTGDRSKIVAYKASLRAKR